MLAPLGAVFVIVLFPSLQVSDTPLKSFEYVRLIVPYVNVRLVLCPLVAGVVTVCDAALTPSIDVVTVYVVSLPWTAKANALPVPVPPYVSPLPVITIEAPALTVTLIVWK